MNGLDVIDEIRVVDAGPGVRPGDDTDFVAVHSRGGVGWYGPVSRPVAQYVRLRLGHAVRGYRVNEHAEAHTALRRATARDTATESAAEPESAATASWAVGAVDCATWDLHGQLAGRPVADLLAEEAEDAEDAEEPLTRDVPLYGSWLSLDLTRATNLDRLARVAAANPWHFLKVALRRTTCAGDPDTEATRLVGIAECAMTATDQPLAFDAVFTWDLALLDSFAKLTAATRLRWLEDPLPEPAAAAYRRTSRRLPLAFGERLRVDQDADAILGLGPVGLTLDVVGCGGLTRARAVTRRAGSAGIPVFPHGRSFLPGIHLAAAFGEHVPAVEFRLVWEPLRQRLYHRPHTPRAGTLTLPDAPGLGTTPRGR